MAAVEGAVAAAQQGRDWYAWWTVFLGILLLGESAFFVDWRPRRGAAAKSVTVGARVVSHLQKTSRRFMQALSSFMSSGAEPELNGEESDDPAFAVRLSARPGVLQRHRKALIPSHTTTRTSSPTLRPPEGLVTPLDGCVRRKELVSWWFREAPRSCRKRGHYCLFSLAVPPDPSKLDLSGADPLALGCH